LDFAPGAPGCVVARHGLDIAVVAGGEGEADEEEEEEEGRAHDGLRSDETIMPMSVANLHSSRGSALYANSVYQSGPFVFEEKLEPEAVVKTI